MYRLLLCINSGILLLMLFYKKKTVYCCWIRIMVHVECRNAMTSYSLAEVRTWSIVSVVHMTENIIDQRDSFWLGSKTYTEVWMPKVQTQMNCNESYSYRHQWFFVPLIWVLLMVNIQTPVTSVKHNFKFW
jgi:hypothetical protein